MSDLEKRVKDINTATIHTPNGNYTIIYGNHLFQLNPIQLPKNCDGLFLETYRLTDSKSPLVTLDKCKSHRQYKSLFPQIEKEKIPVYFADFRSVYGIDLITLAIAEGYALRELKKMTDGFEWRDVSRRDFLKQVGIAGIEAWLWLPFIAYPFRLISHSLGYGDKPSKVLANTTQALHPELAPVVLTARNLVVAYKQQWLMSQMQNSHFVSIFGAMHTGLEDALVAPPKDLIESLKARAPIIKKLVIGEESFYQLIRCDYNGRTWAVTKTHEIPELKELMMK